VPDAPVPDAAVLGTPVLGAPVLGTTAPDGGRLGTAPARELAAWRDRVRKAGRASRSSTWRAAEGEQMPGARLSVSAVVALGS
jgi:hypothetical protein